MIAPHATPRWQEGNLFVAPRLIFCSDTRAPQLVGSADSNELLDKSKMRRAVSVSHTDGSSPAAQQNAALVSLVL